MAGSFSRLYLFKCSGLDARDKEESDGVDGEGPAEGLARGGEERDCGFRRKNADVRSVEPSRIAGNYEIATGGTGRGGGHRVLEIQRRQFQCVANHGSVNRSDGKNSKKSGNDALRSGATPLLADQIVDRGERMSRQETLCHARFDGRPNRRARLHVRLAVEQDIEGCATLKWRSDRFPFFAPLF